MTGYTVHTGSTEKFSGGWDRIFSGKRATKKPAGKKTASSKTGKKAAAGKAKSRKKKTS